MPVSGSRAAAPEPPEVREAPTPVNLLVVDDRPEQRLALEAVFAELPVTIFQADSGNEALRLLLAHDFALILLDVNMPVMDGFELAGVIRGRPRSSRTPIIFVTAATEMETQARRGYSLGAVDFVHVPIHPEVLKAKAEVFVDLYRKTEEVRRHAERRRELESKEHRRALGEAMARLASEARQVEELRLAQRRSMLTQKLASATLAINASHSADEMQLEIVRALREHTGAGRALIRVSSESEWNAARVAVVAPGSEDLVDLVEDEEHGAPVAALLSKETLRLDEGDLGRDPILGPAIEHLDAEARPASWMSAPIGGREQRPLGFLLATDRESGHPFDADDESFLAELAKLASGSLQEMLFREAREANRIKDEFLAVLSHELRTPLSAMAGWAHLLRHGELDDTERERAIEVIERNLKIQTQLIDELLDMSRIVNGKLRLDQSALDSTALVTAALEAQLPAADARSVLLEAELDNDTACVWGDPTRLHQVIANLLSNALKFTPKGGRVTVRVRREGAQLEIRVQDNGEGIDPALLPFIFDRFTQAENSTSRARAGLGLGLTITKRLVELHGGSISAASAGKGLGSCFIVRLPVFDGLPSPARLAGEGAGTDHVLRGCEVFVVDDEPDARDLLATALRRAGAEVTAFATGNEALEALDGRPPHVLISDISMPEEDGYSMIRRLRSRPAEKGGAVPAIALTALADHRDRLQALEAGYQIHLAKPVNFDHLLLAAAALGTRHRDRAASAESLA
jgi:signal transduction histidine kinase/DNA-binding response OmpR family regulator